MSDRFCCVWVGLAVMLVAAGSALAANIRVTDLQVERLDEHRYQVTIHAEAEGAAEIGSFYIGYERSSLSDDPRLPGFWHRPEHGDLLISDDFEGNSPHHLDGGARDESDEAGVFTLTLDTSDWPEAVYYLTGGAHNRPAEGAYIRDRRPFQIVVGEAEMQEQEISNVANAEHRVVYEREGVYASFPELFHLPDGRLGTSFGTRVRASHIDPTGGRASLVSDDGGRAWDEADGPLVDRMMQTESGQLVEARARGWIYADADEEDELRAAGKRVRDVRPGTVAYLGGAIVRRSSDGGRTWDSEPLEIPDDIAGLMNYIRAAESIITSDGVRLTAAYGRRMTGDADDPHGPNEVFILRSDDDGQTWDLHPVFPDGLLGAEVGFNETALAETGDGRILAVMRTEPAGEMQQAFSEDGGITWSEPEPVGFWGYPGHLLRLSDGRLVLSYGYRRDPMGIRAVISEDNGHTWNTDDIHILRKDGFYNGADLGYPMSTEVEDGRIMTIYYFTGFEGITHIATTHWTPRQ